MEAINPFTDPEFKKQILGSVKGGNSVPDDYIELEDIRDDETADLRAMISGAPTIPQKAASNMILDASLIAKTEKEKKAAEMETALNHVLTEYNKRYGLELSLDLHSLSNTLALVSTDPKMTRVLELYTSRIYRNVKAVLSLHLLQRLSLLVQEITDPAYLLAGGSNSELTLADKFLVVEKLISYIDTLSDMKNKVQVEGDDLELQKLAEENQDLDFESSESKEAIDDFMKLFNKEFT